MSWARRRVEVAQRPQVALRTRPRRNRHLTSFYLHYLCLRIYDGVGGPRGSTDVARGQEDHALDLKTIILVPIDQKCDAGAQARLCC